MPSSRKMTKGFWSEPDWPLPNHWVMNSRAKPFRELAPADFSALVYRNRIDDENPLWRLPRAQIPSAEIQKFIFLKTNISDNTGRHFFITQCSGNCRTSESGCLTNPGEPKQRFFDFNRIHFFPSDVDDVRNPSDDFESIAFP